LLSPADRRAKVDDSRPGIARVAREADEVLARAFAGAVSVSSLARSLGVSASYLTRAYRAATGGTLHAHVTRLRLSHALSRLASGANDLTVLALELGYSSHSHFSAEFKRHVGRPPSAFRLSTQV
jgi:AraC family transcriptional regulator